MKASTIVAALALLVSPVQHALSQDGTAAQLLQGRATPEATNRLQQALVAAQAAGNYFASPVGIDNDTCSPAQPCTAQGAFMRCHLDNPQGDVCSVQLADGDYFNPGINVFYYRFASFTGNCSNPSSVRLIGTRSGPLIWVQDHAIGIFNCLRVEGFVGGVSGISGRQYAIVDYNNMIFGNMPGGTHVGMTEFSIASCGGTTLIAGNALVHAAVSSNAKINLVCALSLNGVFNIDFFANLSGWSIIDARQASYTGSFRVNSVAACNTDGFSLVYKTQPFPGAAQQPGNC